MAPTLYVIGFFLITTISNIGCSESRVNPGMRGRITQRGLDYARDIALDILMAELSNIEIPEMEEDIGVGEVTVRNVQMASLPRPEASIIPLPGVGLRWQSSDLNPTIAADYKVRIKVFNVKKRGRLRATGRGMQFRLDFILGRDEQGRLSTYGVQCEAEGDIRLHFTGGWSDVLNVGSDFFRSEIEGMVHAQICDAAKLEIETKLMMELQTIPISEEIANLYALDFALTQFPIFEEDYIEAHLRGAIYLSEDPQEPSVPPPVIPAFPEHTDHMLYFYITDFLINSGLEAAFTADKLAVDLQSVWEKVPESEDLDNLTDYMSTSCPLSLCVGTVFPELGELFPLGEAALHVYATQSPRVTIRGSSVHLEAAGNVDLFVDNSRDPAYANMSSPQPAFSVNMTITAEVAVHINNTRLYFELIEIEPRADVLETYVGDIGNGFLFETLIRVGTQAYLVPEMKKIAKKGIALPKVKDIELIGPTLLAVDSQNVLVVATDISLILH